MASRRAFLRWAAATTFTAIALVLGCVNQTGVPYDMRRWNRPFTPHRVIDRIYYVGTNEIAQFVIATSAGLILLDTGFEAAVPRLGDNIRAVGLRYQDIRFILTSHAHIDHVQGHALVRKQTGAQVVASALDAPFLESGGKGEPVFDGVYSWTPCPVDRRVSDGDTVSLGDTTMVAHLTPGHTPGATTWTMKVESGGRKLDVLFFPSANVNPGVRLVGNQRYPHIATDFAQSFAKWRALPCQVFLGSHGYFYDMPAKFARLGSAENPFIDPDGYQRFVAEAEQRFKKQLDSER